MIEINTQIEDLIKDPITGKYKVASTHATTNKNFARSKSSKKRPNSSQATFKINPQKRHKTRNLIERKGLNVDFIVK